MEIVSVANPRVKQWSRLLTRRGREETGKFVLEGTHLVLEALEAQAAVETVLYSLERGIPAELEKYVNESAGAEWIGVSEAVLAKCTDTQTPQAVAAVCRKPEHRAEQLLADGQALLVAVDGVQDPGNLGTIIRSADAVGATGVLLGRGTVDLYNPKTIRATMGSLFHLPIVECDLREWLPEAVKCGMQVIGTRLGASAHCYEIDLAQPTCLVVGNEGQGVAPDIAAHVTRDIMIPMRGQAESLNVAMATTVLLYEAMRQRYYSTNKNPVHD